MENNYYPFVNKPLPYGYNALEPFIDEKTMRLHHDKHLQTYIDNLNGILKKEPALQNMSLEQLIVSANDLPAPLREPVRNNAGGVYNHRFFFDGMTPRGQGRPKGTLAEQIKRQFGSFENFKTAFKNTALSVFGSGYAWLVYDGRGLLLITTANQDCPDLEALWPIITIDVWEHAYYLKHYNVRAGYIDDFMEVINWPVAETLFDAARTVAAPAVKKPHSSCHNSFKGV